jgi:hypothetical protein
MADVIPAACMVIVRKSETKVSRRWPLPGEAGSYFERN